MPGTEETTRNTNPKNVNPFSKIKKTALIQREKMWFTYSIRSLELHSIFR